MSEFFGKQDDMKEWETMDFGEEAVAVEDPPVDPAPEEETPEATEETAEPEAAAEPEPEAEVDPSARIAELEKRLADKDDFNGRLTNELGELRAMQQQMLESQQAPVVSDWDELLDENPMQAAQYALQSRDTRRLQQAKAAMDEYLPGASEMWERGLAQEYRLNQLAEQVQQTQAPIQQQQTTNQLATALGRLQAEYPDYAQLEGAMQETLTSRPLLQKSLQTALTEGGPDEQYEALRDLYRLTADRTSDTLRSVAKEVAGEHAAETLRAKQEAMTVSATSTADTNETLTASEQIAERIGAEWETMERRYSDGWNIGSA